LRGTPAAFDPFSPIHDRQQERGFNQGCSPVLPIRCSRLHYFTRLSTAAAEFVRSEVFNHFHGPYFPSSKVKLQMPSKTLFRKSIDKCRDFRFVNHDGLS
jgi:hypothetical protein